MKTIANSLLVLGLGFLVWFGYTLYQQNQLQSVTIEEAKQAIETIREQEEDWKKESAIMNFSLDMHEAFGMLHVPKLEKNIGIVEGTDPDALSKGAGHMSSTVFPGQGEQIVLSGHRDTVFKEFAKLNIGDEFIVEMPYGKYRYEIQYTDIVDADDTTVVRKMGEEVLLVSTCYPFHYLGSAPNRFVFYAYPVTE